MIYFDALTEADCEQIRKWRNEDISAARTPFILTDLMQKNFYRDEVSNRDSKHRYWAVCSDDLKSKHSHYVYIAEFPREPIRFKTLLGIAGLTNIEWENGRAEVALMIGTNYRGQGYGKQAFCLLREWAFDRMRLQTIYANVYACNPDAPFWERLDEDFHVSIPCGKWWNGRFWDTMYYQWHNEQPIMARNDRR